MLTLALMLLAALAAPAEQADLPILEGPPDALNVRVIDGDTFAVGSERIRVRRMDAPELDGVCHAERFLAVMARRELATIVGVHYLRITPVARDQWGRLVAEVTVWDDNIDFDMFSDPDEPWPPPASGRSLAEIMIAAGVARTRMTDWCAETDAPPDVPPRS